MEKQNEILKYLQTVESANIEQIYHNCSCNYERNESKWMGEILSRMVKDGRIRRIKPGVFCFVSWNRKGKEKPVNNEPKLF